jgi:hypothetical protein
MKRLALSRQLTPIPMRASRGGEASGQESDRLYAAELLQYSREAQFGFRFVCANLCFKVFFKVTARKIDGLKVALETAHRQAAFERADYQRRQLRGIYVRPNIALRFPLIGDRL